MLTEQNLLPAPLKLTNYNVVSGLSFLASSQLARQTKSVLPLQSKGSLGSVVVHLLYIRIIHSFINTYLPIMALDSLKSLKYVEQFETLAALDLSIWG